MRFDDALADYRLACRARSVNAKTWRWYEQHLGVFRDFLQTSVQVSDVTLLQPRHINLFIEHLQATPGLNGRGPRSSHTVKAYVESIKVFLTWLVEEDLVSARVRERISMPRVSKRVVKTLNPEQYNRLVDAARYEASDELVRRDRAMLAMLLATGMRAAELCTLRPEAVDYSEDFVLVRGKRDKEREIGPLGVTCLRSLRQYLRLRRGDSPYLFLGRRHEPLTPSGLDRILYRLRDWAGPEHFTGVRVSAHTFRHTFAVNYLKQGGDIKRLQLLLGHTSLAVTQGYLEDFQARDARRGVSVLDRFSAVS